MIQWLQSCTVLAGAECDKDDYGQGLQQGRRFWRLLVKVNPHWLSDQRYKNLTCMGTGSPVCCHWEYWNGQVSS